MANLNVGEVREGNTGTGHYPIRPELVPFLKGGCHSGSIRRRRVRLGGDDEHNAAEQIDLKNGTKIAVEAVYGDSHKNPNPFSQRIVTFGEQTTNEMLFVFLGATKEGKGRIKFQLDGKRPAAPADEKKP